MIAKDEKITRLSIQLRETEKRSLFRAAEVKGLSASNYIRKFRLFLDPLPKGGARPGSGPKRGKR